MNECLEIPVEKIIERFKVIKELDKYPFLLQKICQNEDCDVENFIKALTQYFDKVDEKIKMN
jgi:hypothetical protein